MLKLNAAQQEAVNNKSQFLQIIAGPGTGKTRTLAHRIAKMVEDGASPESVLAISFTNHAASELKRRLERLLEPELAARLHVLTYHSLCHQLLSAYYQMVGLPRDWLVADHLDSEHILNTIGSRYKSIKKLKHYESSKTVILGKLLSLEYKKRLRLLKLVDYEDLIELGTRIVGNVDTPYTNIFIDEFQDTTMSQWRLISAMVARRPETSLTAVGDPNQEIFNFQSNRTVSAFTLMAEEVPVSVSTLSTTYRSTHEIVTYYSDLLKEKTIRGVKHGPKPTLKIAPTPKSELREIGSLVQDLLKSHAPADIAVLTRMNSTVTQIRSRLKLFGINCTPFVDKTLLQNAYRRTIYILLKYVLTRSDVHLSYLLHNPASKLIARADAAAIRDEAINQSTSILEVLAQIDEGDLLPKAKASVKEFLAVLRNTIQKLVSADSLESMRHTTQRFLVKMDPTGPSADKLTASKEIMEWLTSGIQDNQFADEPILLSVLRELQLMNNDPTPKPDEVAVQTVHSSKGREWPIVILATGDFLSHYGANESATLRNLLYVGLSRAKSELYVTATGQLPRFMPRGDICKIVRTETPIYTYSMAKKRYPKVFSIPRALAVKATKLPIPIK